MSCEYYKKLLHLNRPGELTDWQQQKLQKHLRKCPECSALMQKILKFDEVVTMYKEKKPVLSDPKVLTHNIIQEIKKPNVSEVIEKRSIFEYIQNIFSKSRFRYSAAAVASVLLLIFLTQQMYIVNKIGSLEAKISSISSDRETLENTIEISSDTIRELFDISKFPQIKNNRIYRQVIDGETVTVDMNTLRLWMEKYDDLQYENFILRILLKNRFPDFNTEAFEKELDNLKSRKMEILKLLYRKL